MIQPISQNNINFSYKKINNGVNQLNAVRLSNDNVSFTSQSQFVSAPVLKMLQQLDVEQPVLGFKGNGKWLLPNLLKVAGQRFNLYMPDGSQLTYQKGAWNDNVLFTLKLNKINEKVSSKIKLRDVDEHLEHKKLRKTKSDKILMFRVNTKDSVHGKCFSNKLLILFASSEVKPTYSKMAPSESFIILEISPAFLTKN